MPTTVGTCKVAEEATNMKTLNILLVLVLLFVLFAALAPSANAEVVHQRVTICRNGKTVTVNSQSAGNAITHGHATSGSCP